MITPRLEISLEAVEHNTRTLVGRLAPRGIRLTGVTKAVLGSPGVAAAMVRGGASGIGDSRVENLAGLEGAGDRSRKTLIRSPMLSQVDAVVRYADVSCNTEPAVIEGLATAARGRATNHGIVLMVELGDLREGVAVDQVLDIARFVRRFADLTLVGIGTNLACQSGVVPDEANMGELSRLADLVEDECGLTLSVVSGGNSANLGWATTADHVGRVNDLRVGESILLGTEPSHRVAVPGLSTDACSLVGEIIEVQTKPSQPWGVTAQAAFSAPDARPPAPGGVVHQALLALGRQDADPTSITPPSGMAVLGMSSDHLVIDLRDHDLSVGDEIAFEVGYSSLLRAATSPFVTTVEHRAPR